MHDISVADGTLIGLLCGDYAGETGAHLVNNHVFSGTRLSGEVSSDHPDTAAYASADASAILSKAFYTNTLAWDFDTLWTWVGEDAAGYPMLKQFVGNAGVLEQLLPRIQADLALTEPVLRASEPAASTAYAGDEVTLTCTLTLPKGTRADEVTLSYGKDKDSATFSSALPMTDNGDGTFSALFPEREIGEYYYSVSAKAGGKTLLYPNQAGASLRLALLSPEAKYQPKQLTLSPGAREQCLYMLGHRGE